MIEDGVPDVLVDTQAKTKVLEAEEKMHTDFKVREDVKEQEPATGQFPYTVDPYEKITIYDDIDVDLTWIAEGYSRAYHRLAWAKNELRRREKVILDQNNRIAELEGNPTKEIPRMPFVDPPDAPEDLIILGERSVQRWVRFLITNFVMLGVGLFLAYIIFTVTR